jgi:LemA protein
MLGIFAGWMLDVDGRWLWAAGLALLALAFNSVVSAANQADTAFSSIGVQLQKRYDLIPNLVAAVERYMEHESSVLERVTALRAQAVSGRLSASEQARVENQITDALRQIVATAESYPELKASESFQQLQRALNEVEEQLAASRRTYNDAAKHLNDTTRMFPTNLIARAFGYREREYFEVTGTASSRPDVAAEFRKSRRG